ncbi:MAG: GNAT family N-acetyltransferase [Bacilli bacterium]|nr:GNAT family N-acetyltransferase [Bacilli bacterium]
MHIKLVNSSSDIRNVASLGNEVFGGYYKTLLGEEQTNYMVDKFLSKKAIKNNISEGFVYYLINNEEQNIGFIALQYRPAFLYISKCYIKEEYRGQGNFKVIFNMIRALCYKHNYKSIKLNVNKHNDLAINVYEHVGFTRESSETINIGNGFYMDDYVYEYQIK